MFETIKKHPVAISAAVIFHVLIGLLFIVGFNFTEKPKIAGNPVPVKIISPQAQVALPEQTKIDLPDLAEQLQQHDSEIKKLEAQRLEIKRHEQAMITVPMEPPPVSQVNTKKLVEEQRKVEQQKEEVKAKENKAAIAKAAKQAEAKKIEQREAKLKARKEAKAEANRIAKRKAKKEAKAKANREAKRKARKEAKQKAAKAEEKKVAKRKAKEKLETEAKKEAKKEAERKAKSEAFAKAERVAKDKAKKEAQAKARAEAEKERKKGMAALAAVAKARRASENAAIAKKKKEQASKQAAAKKATAKKAEQAKAQAKARGIALGNWGNKVARHVRPRWQTPPGSSGMTAKVRVKVSRSGYIRSLKVISCKGSNSFCQSLKQAFKRAEPLPSPSRNDLFDENLNLTFKR